MMQGILIQQNHQLMEENMSNLTSASGEAGSVSSFASPISNPVRKKRNLPGNPDPEAEVIALSPKSLMATNRFLCEICNKGFQRDQNLQLHRRGHNLPWKLKQRSSKEVRRKVYVCPEPSCVHHDPSRALGDLTGVKKHFSRKHGEKKWKCDKCSKKYAVQSDWKAHSKICGTREYRCDCGTIFSRRDSFITHRAFCDALAEESSRSITEDAMAAHQYPLIFSQPMMMMNSPADGLQELPLKRENHGQQQLYYNISRPEVRPCHVDLLPPPLYSHENPSPAAAAAHMSATALLQKAAQMGSAMSRPHHCQMAAHTTSAAATIGAGFELDTMMTNLSGSGFDGSFEEFQGMMGSKREEDDNNMESFVMRNHGGGGGSEEEKTRDFLGLRQFSHREILNLVALDPCISTQQNKKAWDEL